MNCQDIARLLDEADLGGLDTEVLRAVETHVASCPACATDWQLQGRLARKPLHPLPAGAAASCRAAFVAAHRPGRDRRVGRGLLVVGALALAVAAAMFMHSPLTPVTVSTAPPMPAAMEQPVAAAALPAPRTEEPAALPNAAVETQPEQKILLRVQVLTSDPVPQFVADRLAPLADDPELRAEFDKFHAALLEELRKVPGLALLEPGAGPFPAAPGVRSYEMTLGQLARQPVLQINTTTAQTIRESYIFGVIDLVQPAGERSRVNSFTSMLVVPSKPCEESTGTASPVTCIYPAQAARMVTEFREQLFLPGSGPSQSERATELARQSAELNATIASVLYSPAALQSALKTATNGGSKDRARIWRTWRGVAPPEMVDLMLASARQDADDARLLAVATLAGQYADEPRVRAVFETIAREDSRALVRALARSALAGEGAWQAHVLAAVRDKDQKAVERLEGFVFEFNSPVRKGGLRAQGLIDGLGEEGITELARLLPEAVDALPADVGSTTSLFFIVGRELWNHPRAMDALLDVLGNDPRTGTRRIAARLVSNNTTPRVIETWMKVRNQDADPQIRELADSMLKNVAARGTDPQLREQVSRFLETVAVEDPR